LDIRSDDRRYDIDWLRIGATYLLLFFHVGMVFNPAPFFHIRNAEQSFAMLIACGFISLWHMPLFFLLAGWSAFSSISVRSTGGFLRERFFRLVVPLVAACIFLMPAIKYLELSTGLDANYTGLYVASNLQESFRQVIPSGLPVAAPFDETFLAFLPTFFTDLSRFTWSHLWFVAYLITFTLLYLPLFGLIRDSRARLEHGVSAWLIYAPILPLAIVQVTMRERWPGLQNLIDDWANFAYYSTYLLAGFALARWPGLESAAHRERTRALLIGLTSTLVLLLGVLGVFSSPAILLANTAIAGWCFVIALLGWAHRKLTFTTPALGYLTESAFPVYLLHQACIVIPGYFLIQLPLGLWAKFLLLLGVSSVLTIGIYHFLVRPFSIPRLLCGMKTRAKFLRRPLVAGVSGAGVALAAITGGFASTSGATPHEIASPLGLWHAEGGAAQVEIAECNGGLCGRVTHLRSPFNDSGCELRDVLNPKLEEQRRPVLGLEILRATERRSGDRREWGGTIYDPGTGRTYSCTIQTEGEDRLRLRGYIGVPIIGRTTTWIRVGREEQLCRDSVQRESASGEDRS
jgi:glucan biosynthesis protein C